MFGYSGAYSNDLPEGAILHPALGPCSGVSPDINSSPKEQWKSVMDLKPYQSSWSKMSNKIAYLGSMFGK